LHGGQRRAVGSGGSRGLRRVPTPCQGLRSPPSRGGFASGAGAGAAGALPIHVSASKLAASSLVFSFHVNSGGLYPGTARVRRRDGDFLIGSSTDDLAGGTWRWKFMEQHFPSGLWGAFRARGKKKWSKLPALKSLVRSGFGENWGPGRRTRQPAPSADGSGQERCWGDAARGLRLRPNDARGSSEPPEPGSRAEPSKGHAGPRQRWNGGSAGGPARTGGSRHTRGSRHTGGSHGTGAGGVCCPRRGRRQEGSGGCTGGAGGKVLLW